MPLRARPAQGLVELLDVAGARVEFGRPEQRHQTAIGASDHERRGRTHGQDQDDDG